MRAVVQVFTDMFEDEVDLYWMSFKFMKCLDQSGTQIEKLVRLHLLSCHNEGNNNNFYYYISQLHVLCTL